MYGSESLDTRIIQTLKSSNPKFKVWIHRILYQHRHIVSFQRICNFLHGKGICGRTSAYPENIDAIFKRSLNMMCICHFRSRQQSTFFTNAAQPRQSGFTDAFKTAWLGTRFPNSSTHNPDTVRGQLQRCSHHLLLRFSRTGTSNNKGTTRGIDTR